MDPQEIARVSSDKGFSYQLKCYISLFAGSEGKGNLTLYFNFAYGEQEVVEYNKHSTKNIISVAMC